MMLANSFAPDAWLLLPQNLTLVVEYLLLVVRSCITFHELEDDALFWWADSRHGFKQWQKQGCMGLCLQSDCTGENQQVVSRHFEPGTIVQAAAPMEEGA